MTIGSFPIGPKITLSTNLKRVTTHHPEVPTNVITHAPEFTGITPYPARSAGCPHNLNASVSHEFQNSYEQDCEEIIDLGRRCTMSFRTREEAPVRIKETVERMWQPVKNCNPIKQE